jgi:hypothetical protein
MLQQVKPATSATTYNQWKEEFVRVLVSKIHRLCYDSLTICFQNLIHQLLDECTSAKEPVKIPRLLLSGWSELAEANMDIANVDPSKVDRLDPRAEEHPWNEAGVQTRPTTPTKEIAETIQVYCHKFCFEKSSI